MSHWCRYTKLHPSNLDFGVDPENTVSTIDLHGKSAPDTATLGFLPGAASAVA